MAALMNEIERQVCMPQQLLYNIIALFAKPMSTGERPITVTGCLYAWYMSIMSDIAAEWDQERQGFWDDAVKGSSALQAALRRRLGEEVATLLGKTVIGVYYDMEKFYDSISLSGLISWARDREFQPVILCLAMQVHMAPRTLRAGEAHITVTVPTCSIIAGCRQSNRFARAVLYNILDDMHNNHPVCIRQFVDDLAQGVHDDEEGKAIDTTVEATTDMIEMLHERGLKESSGKPQSWQTAEGRKDKWYKD